MTYTVQRYDPSQHSARELLAETLGQTPEPSAMDAYLDYLSIRAPYIITESPESSKALGILVLERRADYEYFSMCDADDEFTEYEGSLQSVMIMKSWRILKAWRGRGLGTLLYHHVMDQLSISITNAAINHIHHVVIELEADADANMIPTVHPNLERTRDMLLSNGFSLIGMTKTDNGPVLHRNALSVVNYPTHILDAAHEIAAKRHP